MIVRVRSAAGMVRVETDPSTTMAQFLAEVAAAMHLTTFARLAQKWHIVLTMSSSSTKTLASLGLENGIVLHLVIRPLELGKGVAAGTVGVVTVDAVDLLLDGVDGMVKRKRDPTHCRHGDGSQCLNCMSLNPWDPAVMQAASPPIKHMSFHTYLRMLSDGADKGRLLNLEELRCTIKPSCHGHAPWPEGLCTKCQPSAITLTRQPYRHTDYVEFETSGIVDRFINAWRSSGCQRMGILLGRFEEYDHVPLGVRAVVAAIYEPPQLNTPDGLEILADPDEALVDDVANKLGLARVGWIFTDLEHDSSGKGAAKFKRFVTDDGSACVLNSGELLFMAALQSRYPNGVLPKYSAAGRFGSKFVTVVVSGDKDNNIGLKAYQATNQAVALVRDDCLRPSIERGDHVFVKESSDAQYVPDVFFVQKDKYGNEIKAPARPYFPAEFLLVTLEAGSKLDNPAALFPHMDAAFPIENRAALGQPQSATDLKPVLRRPLPFHVKVADFHLLLFLARDTIFDIKKILPKLLSALQQGDVGAAEAWQHEMQWASMASAYIDDEGAGMPAGTSRGPAATARAAAGGAAGSSWACPHCTLLNTSAASKCAVCDAPRR